MTTRLIIAMVAFLGLAVPMAWSAESVGVINIAEVFDGYQMTSDLEGLFQLRDQRFKEQSKDRLGQLEARRKELEAFAPNTPDFEERRQELIRLEMEYQVWGSYEQRRMVDEHMRRLLQIYEDTQSAVRTVADARGLDLVLTYDRLSEDAPDSTALRQQILLRKVIYANDRIDLTRVVLEELNRAYQQRGGVESLKLGEADSPPGVHIPKQKNDVQLAQLSDAPNDE